MTKSRSITPTTFRESDFSESNPLYREYYECNGISVPHFAINPNAETIKAGIKAHNAKAQELPPITIVKYYGGMIGVLFNLQKCRHLVQL